MEKEKRKHEPTLQSQYTLKSCPICGHEELEWGMIEDTYYQTRPLAMFGDTKPYEVMALRCLNCNNLVQFQTNDITLPVRRFQNASFVMLAIVLFILLIVVPLSVIAVSSR